MNGLIYLFIHSLTWGFIYLKWLSTSTCSFRIRHTRWKNGGMVPQILCHAKYTRTHCTLSSAAECAGCRRLSGTCRLTNTFERLGCLCQIFGAWLQPFPIWNLGSASLEQCSIFLFLNFPAWCGVSNRGFLFCFVLFNYVEISIQGQ